MRRILTLALLITFLLPARLAGAHSMEALPNIIQQDPAPTPSPTPDVELEEKKRAAALAEEEKKREVAEKEAAEARRDKLKAETEPLGDPTKVTVPTGSVQTDADGFVEVEMLSQEAAKQISNQVMSSLCARKFQFPVKDEKGRDPGDDNWIRTYDASTLRTLIIYDANEVAALELYSSVFKQLQNFQREFGEKHQQAETLLAETNLEAAPPDQSDFVPAGLIAAPGIATGLIKSVAELINLFRTDTEFKNKKISIPEDMVVSFLISKINSGGCSARPTVYYPHFYPPNLISDSSDSEMLKLLKQIGDSKGDAAADIKQITKRIEDINTLVAKLKIVNDTPAEIAKKVEAKKKCKDKKCIEDLNKAIEALQDALKSANEKIDELTKNNRKYFVEEILANKVHEQWLLKLNRLKSLTQLLVDSADLVATKLNTPDDATKVTAMAQLLRAERLKKILEDPLAFTLRIAVTANGTTKIKKNLFVDAKVRHSAGAHLVYQLFDQDGRVVLGDAIQYYFDYQSAGEVRARVSPEPKRKKGKGGKSGDPEATTLASTSAVENR